MTKDLVARNALRVAYSTWTPGIQPSWSVTAVRTALLNHEQRNFSQSSMLADIMMRDDRLSAVVETRVLGLLGLPFSMQPVAEDDALSVRIAEETEEPWYEIVPESELADIYRWYLMLGIAIGELVWTSTRGQWKPRLRVHHPQHLWWDETIERYKLNTKDGAVVVEPGNGKWVLLTDGDRGYMNGLVRSLAIPWLVRQFAIRDWGRYSERHGMPIVVLGIPAVEFADTKDDFVDECKRLATETTIPLPQGANGEASYTMDLLEAKDRTWEGFERLITSCNVSFAVRTLGQNLTTEIQGGSYAAAGIHERVYGDIIRGDEAKLSTQLHRQVMLPFVAFNYGNVALASTPCPRWDTTPPEDQAKRATMLAALIPAIDNADRIGQAIDTDELLAAFGLPTVPKDKRSNERGKLFQYHLQFGTVSINEVRAQLGLPPVAGGDKLISPEQSGAQLAERAERLALSDGEVRPKSRPFMDGADYASALQSSVMNKQPMAPTLEAVAKLIDGAGSFDEVRDGVAGLYAKLPRESMARTLQRALILWRLNGRHSVTEEI